MAGGGLGRSSSPTPPARWAAEVGPPRDGARAFSSPLQFDQYGFVDNMTGGFAFNSNAFGEDMGALTYSPSDNMGPPAGGGGGHSSNSTSSAMNDPHLLGRQNLSNCSRHGPVPNIILTGNWRFLFCGGRVGNWAPADRAGMWPPSALERVAPNSSGQDLSSLRIPPVLPKDQMRSGGLGSTAAHLVRSLGRLAFETRVLPPDGMSSRRWLQLLPTGQFESV